MSETPIYDNVANPEPKKSLVPVPKVAAAGIAGAITVVLIFIIQLIWPTLEIPEAVVAAVTAIIAFAAGYIKSS
jgi:hypothetical protein